MTTKAGTESRGGGAGHAPQNARGVASAEPHVAAQRARAGGSPSVQVVGTRMARHAWRAAREVGARVLHAVLGDRHGSAAEWARRLGIDKTRISDWTGL